MGVPRVSASSSASGCTPTVAVSTPCAEVMVAARLSFIPPASGAVGTSYCCEPLGPLAGPPLHLPRPPCILQGPGASTFYRGCAFSHVRFLPHKGQVGWGGGCPSVAHHVRQRPARFGHSENHRDGETMKRQSMDKSVRAHFWAASYGRTKAPEAGVRPPAPTHGGPSPSASRAGQKVFSRGRQFTFRA